MKPASARKGPATHRVGPDPTFIRSTDLHLTLAGRAHVEPEGAGDTRTANSTRPEPSERLDVLTPERARALDLIARAPPESPQWRAALPRPPEARADPR
jgi:hypothetical protein